MFLMLVGFMFHIMCECGKECAWMFLRAIFGSFAMYAFCCWFMFSIIFSPRRCTPPRTFFFLLGICFVPAIFLFSFYLSFCFHRRLGLMWFSLLFIMHFFYRNTIIRFFPLEWAEWILCYFVLLPFFGGRVSPNATFLKTFLFVVSQTVTV